MGATRVLAITKLEVTNPSSSALKRYTQAPRAAPLASQHPTSFKDLAPTIPTCLGHLTCTIFVNSEAHRTALSTISLGSLASHPLTCRHASLINNLPIKTKGANKPNGSYTDGTNLHKSLFVISLFLMISSTLSAFTLMMSLSKSQHMPRTFSESLTSRSSA